MVGGGDFEGFAGEGGKLANSSSNRKFAVSGEHLSLLSRSLWLWQGKAERKVELFEAGWRRLERKGDCRLHHDNGLRLRRQRGLLAKMVKPPRKALRPRDKVKGEGVRANYRQSGLPSSQALEELAVDERRWNDA